MLEKDLDILTVWESPNGNLFIKISETHSLAIGPMDRLFDGFTDIDGLVKCDNVTPVKIVGELKIKS